MGAADCEMRIQSTRPINAWSQPGPISLSKTAFTGMQINFGKQPWQSGFPVLYHVTLDDYQEQDVFEYLISERLDTRDFDGEELHELLSRKIHDIAIDVQDNMGASDFKLFSSINGSLLPLAASNDQGEVSVEAVGVHILANFITSSELTQYFMVGAYDEATERASPMDLLLADLDVPTRSARELQKLVNTHGVLLHRDYPWPLRGKVAVVTGATKGIGRAITDALIAEGVKVVAIGRDQDQLESLKGHYGSQVYPVQLDLTDAESIKAFPKALPEEFKNVAILINNAGTTAPIEPFGAQNLDNWESILDTNLMGVIRLTHALIGTLVGQAEGAKIINIGSVTGDIAAEGASAYATSKAALEAFSNNLHADYRKQKVNVSLLKLGRAATEIFNQLYPNDPERVIELQNEPHQLQPSDVVREILHSLTTRIDVRSTGATIHDIESDNGVVVIRN